MREGAHVQAEGLGTRFQLVDEPHHVDLAMLLHMDDAASSSFLTTRWALRRVIPGKADISPCVVMPPLLRSSFRTSRSSWPRNFIIISVLAFTTFFSRSMVLLMTLYTTMPETTPKRPIMTI